MNLAIAWALTLAGITLVLMARRLSALKSSAWARFYQRRTKLAELNPLSKHAGTERSIRVGAIMWRVIGTLLLANGLLRLFLPHAGK